MKITSLLIIFTAVMAGCANRTNQADAYGNFEATEVIVSAETAGQILTLGVKEGTDINQADDIALVDTTLFHLQKAEIDAGMAGVKTRINSINAQNAVLDQQIANLEVNIARIRNMLKDDAATQKQYDDLTGQADVIRKQIAANNTQRATVADEFDVYRARKATLDEQIIRCRVRSPLKGTIIEKYAEAGEMTSPGKPLVKIADMTFVKLRAYVDGARIGSLRIGEPCTVRIDAGTKGYASYPGTINYISSKAEFTPKIIQTRDERVTLVYAVTIEVRNDGAIKSGMPGEVIFGSV
ncbi:MAG: HlyD family efflux transporter periplasmic adaptor subunit [Bacteroidales bacterium]